MGSLRSKPNITVLHYLSTYQPQLNANHSVILENNSRILSQTALKAENKHLNETFRDPNLPNRRNSTN